MAKKFEFRLDVVRDMRKRTRDGAARQVAEKLSQTTAARQQVQRLSEMADENAAGTKADRQSPQLNLSSLRTQQLYGAWLNKRLQAAQSTLRQKNSELDQDRAKLTEATAQLKAIEKLRERRYRQHMVLIRREEQAITDETAGRMIQAAKSAQEGEHD